MRFFSASQAIVATVMATCLCLPAGSQRIQIQVSDYHQRPIPGTILSGKSMGTSTTAPTDVAGKTEIIGPPGAQPGDPLPLTLVKAPLQAMIIMAPFNGLATIPRAPWYIEVILGTAGNPWALRNKTVVWSWTAALVKWNQESLRPQANLERVAAVVGFSPVQIDAAIRAVAREASDPAHKALAAAYFHQYGAQ